eukprot:6196654-Pleurochrysis_carterae.AAC.2
MKVTSDSSKNFIIQAVLLRFVNFTTPCDPVILCPFETRRLELTLPTESYNKRAKEELEHTDFPRSLCMSTKYETFGSNDLIYGESLAHAIFMASDHYKIVFILVHFILKVLPSGLKALPSGLKVLPSGMNTIRTEVATFRTEVHPEGAACRTGAVFSMLLANFQTIK